MSSRGGLVRRRREADARVFLSGVRSRSHLVYASAYLRHLMRRKGIGRVTVVNLGLGAFLGIEQVTEDDVVRRLPAGAQISIEHATGPESWRARPGETLIYLAVGAPGIKPYLRLLLANRARLHRVVVDEGLGSYGGWRARWAAGRRQGGRGLRALVRALAVTTAQRRFTDERWALYRRSATGWQPDGRIASEFRSQLSPVAAPVGSRTVVLISQPWVELGQLTSSRYLAVLHEVDRACAAAGLTLRVRPHPAEDRSRYDGLPFTEPRDLGSGPAELDRTVVDATTVLGFNSTALINLSALYGTPVLRLALPELAAVEGGMSEGQRSLLDTFVPDAVPIAGLADRLRSEQQRPGAAHTGGGPGSRNGSRNGSINGSFSPPDRTARSGAAGARAASRRS